MRNKLLFWLFSLAMVCGAAMTSAQITIPNSFTNETIADPDEVNANFTQLGSQALNRTGGTMTGALTLSSGQILFPAAQSAAADVNTLDDYEEGTWTPAITGSGGGSGQTYTTQVGRYVKIGRLVTATFNIVLSAEGTITTDVLITGLPFTIENTANQLPPVHVTFFNGMESNLSYVGGYGNVNTTTARLFGQGAADTGMGALLTADISNTTQLVGMITYTASN
jgi:hypothetical protein